MPDNPTPIRRLVAPTYPLTLEFEDELGKFVKNFRLLFDFNTLARIEAKAGISTLSVAVWAKLNSTLLAVMLWSACQKHSPEYAGDEGLEVIGEYLSMSVADKVAAALWEAYLLGYDKERREILRKLRESAQKGEEVPNAPAPAATPATGSDGSSSGPSLDTTSASLRATSAS